MILYNVWFSFNADADEIAEIEKAKAFLENLKDRKKIDSYRVLRNFDKNNKTKLPLYQVVVEFLDRDQFPLPFQEVVQIGIHSGMHGMMIEKVDKFVVEVFEDF